MSSKNFKFHFKEQWWCLSTLSNKDAQSIEHLVSQIQKKAQESLEQCQPTDLNEKFVPKKQEREEIAKISQNLRCDCRWLDFITDFKYVEDGKEYNQVGYILFRIRLKEGSPIQKSEIHANYMQQIIFRIWYGVLGKFKDEIKYDEVTPPYVFSVCDGYDGAANIKWTTENREKYKEEIGNWVEIYSGQFEDYREELYERRIDSDLSNRLSEMHMIRKNSAFIYMDSDNYKRYFIKDEEYPDSTGYVFNTMINTVVRIRAIAFAMLLVSDRIDQDTIKLGNEEYGESDPKDIKNDLEKTNRLKIRLQSVLAPFFTDLSKSHRQHYSAVLRRAVEINEIELNWKRISDKIEDNIQELNSIFLNKQEESQQRQEKLLNLLNLILGASIVFEIVGYIQPDETKASAWLQVTGILFLLIIVAIAFKVFGTDFIKKIIKEKTQKKKLKK